MKNAKMSTELLDIDADEALSNLGFFSAFGPEKETVRKTKEVPYCTCQWAFKALGRAPSGRSAGVPTQTRKDDRSICAFCGYYVYTVLEAK